MNSDRMAVIQRLTKEAEEWLKNSTDRDSPDEYRAACAHTAHAYIALAQLHVAMGDWPIETEPDP